MLRSAAVMARAAGRVALARGAAPAKAALTVTDGAAERIKALLSSRPSALGVKLGVKTRGCNGMSYTMNYAEDGSVGKFDEVVESHGVKIYIEPRALLTILGTTMDYKDDHISSEFVFTNPNAKGVCGCGESFSV